jgi:hypothetical protein
VSETFTFTVPLWRWSGREGTSEPGSWCFVTLPRDVSDEIRELAAGPPRGFGSVRVAVETGSSRWDTSVFPDAGTGCFVLPVKKAVRDAEGLEEGDDVTVSLRVRDAP